MEPQSRRAHWSLLDYLKSPYGQPKKMALHHDYRNVPKFIYNKIQTPTVVDRFKYWGNNVIPSQWIRKSYFRNLPIERERLSIPELLKNRNKSFRHSAASSLSSKRTYLDREQPKTQSSLNLKPIRPHLKRFESVFATPEPLKRFGSVLTSSTPLKRSESVFTSSASLKRPESVLISSAPLKRSEPVLTSAPWIPQVASNPSTTGYFMLSGMLVFLMVVFCCYLWKRKKKKGSIQYSQIPAAEVNATLCSIHSEPSHFPCTSLRATESGSSVILNMEEVATLPYVNVLVYNGYKLLPDVSQSTSSEKTSEGSSFCSIPVSEGDFVRHYWASDESSSTQMSESEPKTTTSVYLSRVSPSERSKRYQMCGRNSADYSDPQSPSKLERFPELSKNPTDPSTAPSTPSFRTQERHLNDVPSSNISLNFSAFFPVVEPTIPKSGRQSYPHLNCPAGDVNLRISQSDPYFPYLIKEEPSLDGSSISSGYATAVNISADVKVPPNPNPMPSSKNLKRLLFPSSSESEIEEQFIILHSSRDHFNRIKRPKKT
ncbi:hypothetical protein TNIN_456731 [Trichonephila inaurata madagascariensis]|uniref:Uncharacterized protein n=1 Tax=Trichonephila inaurata madagascariensis TaxID=2747483 RepID=A0A8X6YRH0_9ARAC|nr:hypothetical protein TNIN_456731 [Trichonephila inaurata madagascariensis]